MIAQRFSVGEPAPLGPSPEGTAEGGLFLGTFGRPFGTYPLQTLDPNAEALGYSRDVPPGHGPD